MFQIQNPAAFVNVRYFYYFSKNMIAEMSEKSNLSTYQFISKPLTGKRWVIADIHGCCQTFKTLIEKIKLSPSDQLFLLGDYINRGPDSVGVIDFILTLQNQRYQIFPLKGNHEDMLWQSHLSHENTTDTKLLAKTFFYHISLALSKKKGELSHFNKRILPSRFEKRKGLVDSLGRILKKYLPFFENLPYYYETEDFYLVHGGFNFKSNQPLEDYKRMMWLMRPNKDFDLEAFTHKKLIHGHFSVSLAEIQEKLTQNASVIPLDNGCYKALTHPEDTTKGNLCALNLDTLELVVQRNCEF
jgi:serine/threonine protein phosphatase 1